MIIDLAQDTITLLKRNLVKVLRIPDLLVFSTLQPVMFVLLFGYVFGSLAGDRSDSYREFMMAGIFVQTTIFGAAITGSAISEDMQKGIIDRLRTLPMHPIAMLAGRTLSDVLTNILVLCVMSITGLAIGWRVHSSALSCAVAYLLLLAFSYAISWLMTCIGLLVRTPQVVSNAAFLVAFPATFIANTFAPGSGLPDPLREIAGWNPISALTQAVRMHFGNVPVGVDSLPGGASEEYTWALQHPEVYTLLWVGVLLTVFVPLANALYKRTS